LPVRAVDVLADVPGNVAGRRVLPRGQLTHVLRHTFAAHFMMSGGNILALQKIPGRHEIKMTMRYAHLAPDHLETALRFNR